MTREQKLALIIGFSLVLLVGVLVSDHLSGARNAHLADVGSADCAAHKTTARQTNPRLRQPHIPTWHGGSGRWALGRPGLR